MECEWCGHKDKVTEIGHYILCDDCAAMKEEEDAFDSFFQSHSIILREHVEAFFASRGHNVFLEPISFLEYIGKV